MFYALVKTSNYAQHDNVYDAVNSITVWKQQCFMLYKTTTTTTTTNTTTTTTTTTTTNNNNNTPGNDAEQDNVYDIVNSYIYT